MKAGNEISTNNKVVGLKVEAQSCYRIPRNRKQANLDWKDGYPYKVIDIHLFFNNKSKMYTPIIETVEFQ